MPVKTSIQLRRDTAANWASANPVLAAGEVGVESDTSKFKIGNGTSSWTSLVYFKKSSGAVAPTVPTVTSKNTNYTIQAADANNIIEMNSSSALSVTLPSDATANIAAGQSIDIVQMGAGTVSFINEKEFAGLIPSNATTWTTVNSNFGASTIRSIAYSNGLWVAGGSTGQIRTSTNGSTWTTVTSNFGNSNINAITYGNGLWVAGGLFGTMRTSTDGTTWTTVNPNFLGNDIFSVAYGNGLWIAGGGDGQMRTSTNATTWTTVNPNFKLLSSTINDINGIAKMGSRIVVAGNQLQVRYSDDNGVTWDNSGNLWSGNYQLTSIKENGSVFVATMNSLELFFVSTNGVNWSSRGLNFGNVSLKQSAYGNGVWLVVGETKVYRSTDSVGSSFSAVSNTSTAVRMSGILSVGYGNGLWLIGGYGAAGGAISSSTNGSTWTTVTAGTSNSVTNITYGNGLWVLAAGPEIRTSNNGSSWTGVTSNFGNTNIFSLAYGNGVWVAGGFNGTMRISTNGSTWTTITSPVSTPVRSLSFTGGTWFASTFASTPTARTTILTSTDGTTWTTIPIDFVTSTQIAIRNVAYGNGLWVAGGYSGQIRTSTNGSTWTTVNSNFGNSNINAITYGNELWVASGSTGQIRTSTNGSTWTTVTSNFGNSNINAITHGNGLWVAGGYSGQMRISTNGSTWTTVNPNFGTSAILAISYGNNSWIAGGNATTASFPIENFIDLSTVLNRSGMSVTQYSILTAYKTAANTWTVTNQSLGTTGT